MIDNVKTGTAPQKVTVADLKKELNSHKGAFDKAASEVELKNLKEQVEQFVRVRFDYSDIDKGDNRNIAQVEGILNGNRPDEIQRQCQDVENQARSLIGRIDKKIAQMNEPTLLEKFMQAALMPNNTREVKDISCTIL